MAMPNTINLGGLSTHALMRKHLNGEPAIPKMLIDTMLTLQGSSVPAHSAWRAKQFPLLLQDAQADREAESGGQDTYFAELDFIDVVGRSKEGYESSVSDIEDDKLSGWCVELSVRSEAETRKWTGPLSSMVGSF